MLSPDGWEYQLNEYVVNPQNIDEVEAILGELFATDVSWPGKEQEDVKLIKRLRDIGELKLFNEFKDYDRYKDLLA